MLVLLRTNKLTAHTCSFNCPCFLFDVSFAIVAAGAKGLIDHTYFKSTMEFRARTGLLLEAALRVAMSAKSYRLAKTIVETVSMFKVGAMSHDEKKTLDWFNSTMRKPTTRYFLPKVKQIR